MPWWLMSKAPWANVSAGNTEWLDISGMVALKVRTGSLK